MGYQALYRQWRPMKFADVTGQENVIRTLKNQITNNRIAHAYLFAGIRGTGKTTVAKIFARAVNCLHPVDGDPCGECEICKMGLNDANPDILEIDAASNNGVDDVRELIEKIAYTPTVSRYKVYIIDEVHMLSKAAFNALLKTLEEPPSHAVFILATTDPQKVLPTVLSRCQRYEFRRMTEDQLTSRMSVILNGIGREAMPEALSAIAVAAEGGMRDAITLLDTCLSYTDGVLDEETARIVIGSGGRDFVFAVSEKMFAFDVAGALTETDQAIKNGYDAGALMSEITAHLRSVLVARLAPGKLTEILGIPLDTAERLRKQAGSVSQHTVMYMLERFAAGESDLRWASNSRNMLELTIVRACTPENETSPEALTARIDELEAKLRQNDVASRVEILEDRINNAKFTISDAEPKEKAASAAAPVKKGPVLEVTGPDSDKFAKAIELLCTEFPSLTNYASSLVYLRTEGDTVVAGLKTVDLMRSRMLGTRAPAIAAKLTEVFGREMHFVLEETANQPKKGTIPVKVRKELDQVYNVFGRENVDLTD